MQTRTNSHLVTYKDWTFRLRPAIGQANRLLLLLHGWKGDESSMWVFTRNLPDAYTVLAPRAPYADPSGGYSWRENIPGRWGYPSIDDLHHSAEAVLELVDEWSVSAGLDAIQFDLIGFSQGAALAYTITMLYPEHVGRLAALSGFLPSGFETYLERRVLGQKSIFVAHGRQDELIPVDLARDNVAALEASGVQVMYCESDSGHRVSKECLKGVEAYFLRMI